MQDNLTSDINLNEYWTVAILVAGSFAIGFIIGFGLGQ